MKLLINWYQLSQPVKAYSTLSGYYKLTGIKGFSVVRLLVKQEFVSVIAKKFEETPLHFLNISKELVSNYYHCEGGETISLIGICDGQRDCFYGNDEMNCKVDACK